jgi:hypothetical protein
MFLLLNNWTFSMLLKDISAVKSILSFLEAKSMDQVQVEIGQLKDPIYLE